MREFILQHIPLLIIAALIMGHALGGIFTAVYEFSSYQPPLLIKDTTPTYSFDVISK